MDINNALDSMATVFALGHAMCDYLQKNPERMAEFAAYVRESGAFSDEDMTDAIDVAHDFFAGMGVNLMRMTGTLNMMPPFPEAGFIIVEHRRRTSQTRRHANGSLCSEECFAFHG